MLRRSILALAANSLLIVPGWAHTTQARFGRLTILWPHAYDYFHAEPPVVLAGPHGQEVTVSVYPAADPAAGCTSASAEDARKLVEGSLRLVRSAAEGFGAQVVPATRSGLPDGSTLVSAASEWQDASSMRYLLQFSVVSRCGDMAYVTVQGKDARAATQYEEMLPLFRTVRWRGERHLAERDL